LLNLLSFRKGRKPSDEGAKLELVLILLAPEIIDSKFCPEDELS
jgi:hypothetical protein